MNAPVNACSHSIILGSHMSQITSRLPTAHWYIDFVWMRSMYTYGLIVLRSRQTVDVSRSRWTLACENAGALIEVIICWSSLDTFNFSGSAMAHVRISAVNTIKQKYDQRRASAPVHVHNMVVKVNSCRVVLVVCLWSKWVHPDPSYTHGG